MSENKLWWVVNKEFWARESINLSDQVDVHLSSYFKNFQSEWGFVETKKKNVFDFLHKNKLILS